MEDISAIELHVLECMLNDCTSVGLQALSHYLAAFADHEDIVRRCYEQLRDDRSTC
ncbi:MAG: hypothetical protein ACI89X_000565 [Planctomycetota bacterium]|jgi:hypothetical protein